MSTRPWAYIGGKTWTLDDDDKLRDFVDNLRRQDVGVWKAIEQANKIFPERSFKGLLARYDKISDPYTVMLIKRDRKKRGVKVKERTLL